MAPLSLIAAAMLCAPAATSAQTLDVPLRAYPSDGQAADCASSTVAGLDPNGDGFLAVRAGPGTGHRKIDEIRNGQVVATCDGRPPWVGIRYRASGTGAGPANRQGWVHGNWLRDLAG